MDPAEIALAIRNGTLDYSGCMTQFYEHKHNFANDAELLPDIRQRGVTIFDDAIRFGVLTAIAEEKPVVTVLQEVLKNVGALYVESEQRLEEAANDTVSALANVPDDLPKQIADHGTENEEVGLLDSYEESDDLDDAADSASDYECKGRKRIGKGKRKPGRPKNRGLGENKVNEAVLARQKRKRLSHWSPKKLGRNPKRRLYESPGGSSEMSGRASASSSKLATATRKRREDDATSPSPSSALATSGKGKYQKASRTSSKRIDSRDRRSGDSANINSPSLIVKLKIRSLVVQLQMPTIQNHHPETPSKSSQAHRKRGVRAGCREKVKSVQFLDTDIGESDNGEDKAQPRSTEPASETTTGPASENAVRTRDLGDRNVAQSKVQNMKTAQPQESEQIAENTSSTKRPTRQRQGDQVTTTSFRNETPAGSFSKQQTKALGQRRGAISQPSNPSSSPALPDQAPSDPATQADDEGEIDTAPAASSSSILAAKNSSTNRPLPSTPAQQTLAYTFVLFPPTLSPRALTPFHRGAIIALENVLADHADEPEDSLLDLVTELDDTRPIVRDREHVAVMKGGSWVFQVLRDVWEDRKAERGDGGDGQEEEGEEQLVDIKDVVKALEEWVGMEMERLGGVVDV